MCSTRMEKTMERKPEDAECREPNIFVIQIFYNNNESRQKDYYRLFMQ